jgi:hypothetical protein
MSSTERELMGFALGLTDPGDALVVGEGLADDPLASLRVAGAAALEGLISPGPRLRPPSLCAQPGRVLGPGEALEPGDRLVLRIASPVADDRVRLALFREVEGSETLLFPQPGRAWPGLEVFRREDGERLVDLVLEEPAGLHRYTLVLLPVELYSEPWPQDDPRWEGVRQAAQRGDLPCRSTEILVGGIQAALS